MQDTFLFVYFLLACFFGKALWVMCLHITLFSQRLLFPLKGWLKSSFILHPLLHHPHLPQTELIRKNGNKVWRSNGYDCAVLIIVLE